ncbi:protein of unknown function DUF1312 [Flexistipes sinusarabici DSM 4947]|uniref:Uncharacterized protein n=2 Tax=Flexistipes sinusarabici TaxID=2352 RepID=F8E873_FLESM|nr:NusG domain II-containing protein [Flexistipes sinusarabici]AEI15070.1 protein of unknown function DUF1312 [Flexistipes sinusarabici DSM 4947]
MKYPTKADLFVILFLIAACLYPVMAKDGSTGKKSLFLLIGQKQYEIPFEDGIIDLNSKYNVNMILEIKDKKARFIKSDCPDKLCIKYGWVNNCGEMAVCVPNKAAVQIKCEKEGNIDAISR